MSIKGTETEKNLLKSFAGESQARMRYDYFASQAKKDGFEKAKIIFEETASQEREHAKRFFKFLEGGGLEITAVYPAGKIGSTAENLRSAAEGEHEEHTILYPEFAKVAEKEGFSEIAAVWRNVSVAEKHHEERYLELLNNIEKGTMFKKGETVLWRCLNCGFIHEGNCAPDKCPACNHPQAWFEVLGKNW